jgi:ATP adenylyltransferase
VNHLWAPWRMKYVSNAEAQDGCVFCACTEREADDATGVLAHASHNFVILNAFPYNSGHLMVVPYEHQSDFTALPAETLHEMMALAQVAVAVLQQEFRCEGANVGLNIGKAAGAGIKDHLHLHIVPRWGGDTNFMTTLDDTRVVPQSLEDTWARLAPCLQRAIAEAGLA